MPCCASSSYNQKRRAPLERSWQEDLSRRREQMDQRRVQKADPPVQLSLDAFAQELEGEGLKVPDWLQQGPGRASFQKALHAIMMKERVKPY